MKLGHKCWCKTEGHPWHQGRTCGAAVTRKLKSGKVAKTCQTCFDANQLLRVTRLLDDLSPGARESLALDGPDGHTWPAQSSTARRAAEQAMDEIDARMDEELERRQRELRANDIMRDKF
jgi:hypothetical protein